jgi:hypothetical protein
MSEYSIDTLPALLETYKVVVPIVQRDYAQGRHDDHTKMVRANLLKDIKSAILHETPPLDLNFVYGKAEEGKFIPIDGQQRLTTLFLLYLYAFHEDDSKTNLLQNFTYETRTSSRVFLEKLIQNRRPVFMSELSPSVEIEDSEWFISGWKYDPTIQSVLTMLNDIKKFFGDVDDISQHLSNQEFKPVVFRFLEMKDLGMEDSLYIKLNARGKSLTLLENFKARLIGRLQKLNIPFFSEFEQFFDIKWTDLFWSNDKGSFDQIYLTFFGVLLMNNKICQNDTNWSNTLDYEKIGVEIYEITFHTLNFICNTDKDNKTIREVVFNALQKNRTYQDRILFHAVTTYLYKSKGIDTGSLSKWMRIIKNLTLNSQVDNPERYRSAINGVNKLVDNRDEILEYVSKNGTITFFNQEQIEEERAKAQIILKDEEFALAIYNAEQHPYFSGQIRSALYFAKDSKGDYDKNIFSKYWAKISKLFDEKKPKNGVLLRQALLSFGDYTLPVGEYRTLCVDDPNETANTPSLKRLFSNNGSIVKRLLDDLNFADDVNSQLKIIVENSTVPQNDWRYCFIRFSDLFEWMSMSHLRLRKINDEAFIIPNKASKGYIYDVFLSGLYMILEQKGISSDFDLNLGTWADHYLSVKEFKIRFKQGKIVVNNAVDEQAFETKTDNPLDEATQYLLNQSNAIVD